MTNDLVHDLRTALQPYKGQWRSLSDELGVSYNWLSEIARGTYQSEPSYRRLKSVMDKLNKMNGK